MKKLYLTGKERFLVVRTDRIGDLVLSTPVPEAIKSHYPESHITMMVSPYAVDVIRGNPNIDEVIVDDTGNQNKGIKGFFVLLKEIRRRKFDIAILLKPTLRLAVLLFLAGVKHRIGTGFRFYQILFNQKVYMHRKVNLKHEVEYNLEMLRPLGIISQRIMPQIYVAPQEKEFVRNIFDEFKITPEDTVVAIHPGSGNSSLNLPAKRFAEVADALVEKMNAKIVFTGSDKERQLIDFIKSKMRYPSIDLTGRTTIPQLVAVLQNCDVLISNSTGPMHLAAVSGTPTVAIFCPVFSAGPIRWGPYGEGHQVILPPVPVCFECKPKSCPHYDCMEKIKADQIISKVELVLKEKSTVKNIR
ncbi:MAG: glycosyltransferase family 9 protein [Candidatus Zixiibacteriota bacterium]